MTKNGIIALFIAFGLILLAFAGGVKLGRTQGADEIMSHVYPRCGVVCEVNRADDVVTIVDGTGMEWQLTECEDWDEGDWVAMIMDDNGTPDNIYDDIITDAVYGGTSEG